VFGAPFCRGHSVRVWAANRLGKGRVTSCSSTACSSTWPNGYSSQRGSNLMLSKPITHSIHSCQPKFHTPFSSIDLWYHHICRIPIFWICMWSAYRGVQFCFPVPRKDSVEEINALLGSCCQLCLTSQRFMIYKLLERLQSVKLGKSGWTICVRDMSSAPSDD
jgi:hypothetical protein